MKEFKRGDQIKFDSGNGEIEYGFVTEGRLIGTESPSIFCRFWSNFRAGELRTMANSERCNERNIKKSVTTIPQFIIEAWLEHFGYESSV